MEHGKKKRMKPKSKAVRTKTGFRITPINRRRVCRLMCIECMGWAEAEVNRCKTKCPLSDFRSMVGEQNAMKRDSAVRKFCLECMNGKPYLISQCISVYCPLYPYRNSRVDGSVLFDRDTPDDVILKKTEMVLKEALRMSLDRLQEL